MSELVDRKRAEISAAIEQGWAAEMRGWFPDAPPGQFGPADPALAALSVQSEQPTKGAQG
jgi:hypothetical protein